ncbi:MAG: hypothetical protein OEY94_00440 [Alphaproteobacteria bacterium]|nr:hypothetical protein [Alphaproteobacteria bacterium]
MRKIIYFLLIIPILAVLAHDVFLFTQNQDKGFMLSDAGWIWSKYHPETHDQWKIKLKEYEDAFGESLPLEKIADLVPVKPIEEEEQVTPLDVSPVDEGQETEGQAIPDEESYAEEFTQKSGKEGSEVIPPKQHAEQIASERAVLQDHVGFLLEQKAVFIFFGFLVLVYLIDLILFQMIFGFLLFLKPKSKKNKQYGRRQNY